MPRSRTATGPTHWATPRLLWLAGLGGACLLWRIGARRAQRALPVEKRKSRA